MLVLALACRSEAPLPTPGTAPVDSGSTVEPPRIAFVERPEVLLAASPEVRLAHRLVASTDRPTQVTVALDDGVGVREIAFPDLANDHDLPLLGLLPETSYLASATFTDVDGSSVTAELSFATEAPHAPLPRLEVLVAVPERMEPGYTVFPTEIAAVAVIVAVDAQGRPVWSFSHGPSDNRALAFRDGVFTALLGPEVLRFTPLGDVLGRWLETGVPGPGDVLVGPGLHHEAAFEADGSFWTFRKDTTAMPAYPTSYEDPSVTEAVDAATDTVVHFAADGTVLAELDLTTRLDPGRIGFGSLEAAGNGELDWSHGNAVVPLEDGSGVIVSLRHQDAVVKLSLPDGEVEWILANPDGWSAEHDLLRLQPAGPDFSWPYHQHAPMVGPDGRLWLFDNGNDGRTTPYSQQPDPLGSWSRIAAYEIDEVNRTVQLSWTHPGASSLLFSQALGNADAQPLTGNVLATFAYIQEEEGVANELAGRGRSSVRLVEVDPDTDEVVFDLRVSTDLLLYPDGLLTDRAIRVPTLYGPGVTERWLD